MRCIICRGKIDRQELLVPCKFPNYKRSFDLYKCKRCGVVQTIPIPSLSEFSKEYIDQYMSYGDKNLTSSIYSAERRFSIFKKALKIRNIKGLRILDIGCATGEFLLFCKNLGFDVYGCELSTYAAKKANKLLGDNRVKNCEFDKLKVPKEGFDVIYANSVIEHIPNPLYFLRKCKKHLKPSGLLVIGTVNIDSLTFKIQKGNWSSLKKPDHVVFFSPKSLMGILNAANFTICSIYYTGTPPISLHRKKSVEENINITKLDTSKRSLTRFERLKKKILKRKYISKLISVFIHLFRIGDTFIIVARKNKS